jgi:hypothetical protein
VVTRAWGGGIWGDLLQVRQASDRGLNPPLQNVTPPTLPPPPWIFPLVVIFMVRTAIINYTEDKGVAWLVQMGKSCRFCKGNSDPYELKTI